MTRSSAIPAAAAFLCAFLAASCRPERLVLGPVPSEIRTLEGYASIRYSRAGASAKSRLAFLLAPPGRGRIEVLGPLNQRLFEVSVDEPEAVLILPSKRAYWRGPREEVFETGLGFPLSLPEIAALLLGRWEGAFPDKGWALDRDAAGRAAAGRRPGFEFRIEEFFPAASIARKLSFRGGESAGTLTLLSVEFNTADPEARIGSSVPPGYVRVSRAEMEKMLRDEN
jgi:hypothetical protein